MNKYFRETFFFNLKFMVQTYYGGDGSIDILEKNINNNWQLILVVIVVIVALYFLLRESFTFMKDLPYTSGAGLRISSVDSSTNRGRGELEYWGNPDAKLKATLVGY